MCPSCIFILLGFILYSVYSLKLYTFQVDPEGSHSPAVTAGSIEPPTALPGLTLHRGPLAKQLTGFKLCIPTILFLFNFDVLSDACFKCQRLKEYHGL